MMSTIFGWLLSAVGEAFEAIITAFLDALDFSLESFITLFPFAVTAYSVFQTIGVGLTAMIAVWQLFKFFLGPLAETKDTPIRILIRSAISIILIYYGGYFMSMIVDLAKTPYDALLSADAVTWDWNILDIVIATTGSGVLARFGLDASAQLLISLAMLLIIGYQVIKLLLEIIERFILLGVVTYTAPLIFPTVASQSTSSIFGKWLGMFFGQCAIMTMSVWSLKLILSAFSLAAGIGSGTIIWLMAVLGMCRIAMRIDTYMQQLGIGVGITGGGLLDELLGTVANIARIGQTVSNYTGGGNGKSGGSKDGVLGGTVDSSGKVKPQATGSGLFGATATAYKYAASSIKESAQSGEGVKKALSKAAKAAKTGALDGAGVVVGKDATGKTTIDKKATTENIRAGMLGGRKAINNMNNRRSQYQPPSTAQAGTAAKARENGIMLDDVATKNGLKVNSKSGAIDGQTKAVSDYAAAQFAADAPESTEALTKSFENNPFAAQGFLEKQYEMTAESANQNALAGAALATVAGAGVASAISNGKVSVKDAANINTAIGAMQNTANGNSNPQNGTIDNFKKTMVGATPSEGYKMTGDIKDDTGKVAGSFAMVDKAGYETMAAKGEDMSGYTAVKAPDGSEYYMKAAAIGAAGVAGAAGLGVITTSVIGPKAPSTEKVGTAAINANGDTVLDDTAKEAGLRVNSRTGAIEGQSQNVGDYAAAQFAEDKPESTSALSKTFESDPYSAQGMLEQPYEMSADSDNQNQLAAAAMGGMFGAGVAGAVAGADIDAVDAENMNKTIDAIKNTADGNTAPEKGTIDSFKKQMVGEKPEDGYVMTGNVKDDQGNIAGSFSIVDKSGYETMKNNGDDVSGYTAVKAPDGSEYYIATAAIGEAENGVINTNINGPQIPTTETVGSATIGANGNIALDDKAKENGLRVNSRTGEIEGKSGDIGNYAVAQFAEDRAESTQALAKSFESNPFAAQSMLENQNSMTAETSNQNTIAAAAMTGAFSAGIASVAKNGALSDADTENMNKFVGAMKNTANGNTNPDSGTISDFTKQPVGSNASEGFIMTGTLKDSNGETAGTYSMLDKNGYETMTAQGKDVSAYSPFKAADGSTYYVSAVSAEAPGKTISLGNKAPSIPNTADTGTAVVNSKGDLVLNDTAKQSRLSIGREGEIKGTSETVGRYAAAQFAEDRTESTDALRKSFESDPYSAQRTIEKLDGVDAQTSNQKVIAAAAMTGAFGNSAVQLATKSDIPETEALNIGTVFDAMDNTANRNADPDLGTTEFSRTPVGAKPSDGYVINGNVNGTDGNAIGHYTMLDNAGYETMKAKGEDVSGYTPIGAPDGAQYYVKAAAVAGTEGGVIGSPRTYTSGDASSVTTTLNESFGNGIRDISYGADDKITNSNLSTLSDALSGKSGSIDNVSRTEYGLGNTSDVEISGTIKDAEGNAVKNFKIADQARYDSLDTDDRRTYAEFKSETGASYYAATTAVPQAPNVNAQTTTDSRVSNAPSVEPASGVSQSSGSYNIPAGDNNPVQIQGNTAQNQKPITAVNTPTQAEAPIHTVQSVEPAHNNVRYQESGSGDTVIQSNDETYRTPDRKSRTNSAHRSNSSYYYDDIDDDYDSAPPERRRTHKSNEPLSDDRGSEPRQKRRSDKEAPSSGDRQIIFDDEPDVEFIQETVENSGVKEVQKPSRKRPSSSRPVKYAETNTEVVRERNTPIKKPNIPESPKNIPEPPKKDDSDSKNS